MAKSTSAKRCKWPSVIGCTVGMYGTTVVLCNTKKEWLQARAFVLGKDAAPPEHVPAFGACTDLENGRTGHSMQLIGVFDGDPSTLVHELGHAAFNILDAAGIPYKAGPQSEAFCYLQGYLFSELLPHLKKPKRGKK
jgi:hypothetical protein